MMLRFIVAIIASLVGISAAHAQCATAYSKAGLNQQISSDFPDNMSGQITPLDMRTFQSNAVQSWQQFPGVNMQVGTSYTIALGDYGQLVLFSNNSPIAVTLPAASTTGFCPFGFYVAQNGTGTITITPTAGTINNAATYTLTGGQSAFIVSDGTNWQTLSFRTGNAIVNGGLINQLAYYAANGNTISGLPTVASSVMTTNAQGTPTWATTLPSGLIIPSPTFTGTVTGPDASSWDSTGLNSVVIGASTAENGTFNLLAFTTLSAASLAASPSTVTGLTVNNSPNTSNDYIPYFHAGTNTIERATVGSISSAGSSGVTSLNGSTGSMQIVAGDDSIAVNTVTSTITLSVGTLPTTQTFLNTGNIGYTTPAGVQWIEIRMVGGGGGGGSGTGGGGGSGGNGSATCWSSSSGTCTTPLYEAGGGGAGNSGQGNSGGSVTGSGTCLQAIGGGGGSGVGVNAAGVQGVGGAGGNSALGGGGYSSFGGGGGSGQPNTGGGGGGGGESAPVSATVAGGGGGAGAYCYVIIKNPSASYFITVGSGGAGGSTGGSAFSGGAGGKGGVWVTEHYGT